MGFVWSECASISLEISVYGSSKIVVAEPETSPMVPHATQRNVQARGALRKNSSL